MSGSRSRMPTNKDTKESYVIEPKTVQHLNYNPKRSHVGSYPREIQLFPLELRPVVDDQQRKKLDFYNEMRSRKLEEQRKREEEMMEHRQQMSEKRYRIPRRPRGCDEETCPTLNRSSCTQGSDVYRNILGPTPDESILAGLQTVIEICGLSDVCHLDSEATDSRLLTTSSRNTTYTSQDYTLRRTSSESSQDDTYSSRPRHQSEMQWCRRPWCRCDLHDQYNQRYRDTHHFPRECTPCPPCPLRFPPCSSPHIGDSLPSTSFHCGLPNCPVPLYKDERGTGKKGTLPLEPHLRDLKNKSVFSPRTETSVTGFMHPMHQEKSRKYNIALHEDVIGIVAENDTQTTPIIKNDKGTTMSKHKSNEIRNILKPEQESSSHLQHQKVKSRGSGEIFSKQSISTTKKLNFLPEGSHFNSIQSHIKVADVDDVTKSISQSSMLQQDEIPPKHISPQCSTSNCIENGTSTQPQPESDEKLVHIYEGSLNTDNVVPDKVNFDDDANDVESLEEQPPLIKTGSSGFIVAEQVFNRKSNKVLKQNKHMKSITSIQSHEEFSSSLLPMEHESKEDYTVKQKTTMTQLYRKPYSYQKINNGEIAKKMEQEQKYRIRKPSSTVSILKPRPYQSPSKAEIAKQSEQGERYFIKKALSSGRTLKQSRSYQIPNREEITKKLEQEERYYIKKSLSSGTMLKQSRKHEVVSKGEIAKKLEQEERYYVKKALSSSTMLEQSRQHEVVSKGEIAKKSEQEQKYGIKKSLSSVSIIKAPPSMERQSYIFPEQSENRKHAYIDQRMKINTSLHSVPSSIHQYYQAIDVREIIEQFPSEITGSAPPMVKEQSKAKSINFDLSDRDPSLHSAPIAREESLLESVNMLSKRMQMRHSFPLTSKHRKDEFENQNQVTHTIHPDKHRLLIVPTSVNQSYEAIDIREIDDTTQEGTRKEVSRNKSNDRPIDKAKDRPKDKSKDRPVDTTKDRPIDKPKNRPIDKPKNRPTDKPKNKPTSKDIPKDTSKDRSIDKSKDIPKDKPIDRSKHRSTDRIRLSANDIEGSLVKSSGVDQRLSKKCSCVDKCCGPSSEERFPWSKLRLNKSISGRSWGMSMRDSRDLTAQNFPPVNLPSSKSFLFNRCFNKDCKCLPGEYLCPAC